MAGKQYISDPSTGTLSKVTTRGQLVVAPLDFSQTSTQFVDVINTGYNLYAPVQYKRFVITDILLYANKNVSATDATVFIYEASSATSTTVDSTILQIEMPKYTARDITGINLITSQGKWINIKTDDDDIYCTMMGYYVDN